MRPILVSFIRLMVIPVFAIMTRAAAPAGGDLVVYDSGLASGWQDWSWDSTRDFNSTAVVRGSASIAITYTKAYGGLSLRTAPALDPSAYSALAFWINGGSATRQLNFYTMATDVDTPSNAVAVTAAANTWTPVTVTLAVLGNPTATARLTLQDASPAFPTAGYTIYVDGIRYVGSASSGSPAQVDIRIGARGPGTPVDSRLLGSNIAAWFGPATYADSHFQARVAASGVTVLRMPGGSWSNSYGWLSCELRKNQPGALPCGSGWESWAARPTDFINFLRAVNKPGMWVANINGASKEAAAAVAFFNSPVTDTALIGIDIRGTDWYTAGHWAQLRAAHGNPQPLGIRLWGVGNEVYGGKPGDGTACTTTWGWEDVWTCDGTQYVNGIGTGTSRHEGFREFRDAMRAIDPTIQVGAVGVSQQSSWTDWGNKVIAAAGQFMDFYDIHQYAYDTTPVTYAAALAHPQAVWAPLKANAASAMATYAGGRDIPLGITEYNLFNAGSQDAQAWMTRAVDSLFMADTLGQQIQNGYALANQWLLAGNTPANGTDYGLLWLDAGMARSPQYFAYRLWSHFGSQMLSVTSTLPAATALSVYAGRIDTHTLALYAINKTGAIITATISTPGAGVLIAASADAATATTLSDQTMAYNGVPESALSDDLSNAPATTLAVSPGSALAFALQPYSLTLIRMTFGAYRAYAPLVALPQ